MWRYMVLAGLALAFVERPATADETGGPYVALGMSAGWPNDPRAAGVYEADLGMELGGSVSFGYAFPALRAEVQLGYESFLLNNVNPLPGSALSEADSTGSLSGPVVMVNLLHEFGAPGGARPFIGGGVGFSPMKADYHGFYCTVLPPGCWDGDQIVGGSDTVAAWQGMAGLVVPMRSGRGEWYIGYRYFATADIALNVVGYGGVTQEGAQSHSIMLGWRWPLGPLAAPAQ